MPKHLQGVLLLAQEDSSVVAENRLKLDGALAVLDGSQAGTLAKSISSVIQACKSRVTRECNQRWGGRIQLWQRGYYDHVIRDERGLERIRGYVSWNPAQWELDKENPQHAALNAFYDWLETCTGAPPIWVD
jgi:putative transposase